MAKRWDFVVPKPHEKDWQCVETRVSSGYLGVGVGVGVGVVLCVCFCKVATRVTRRRSIDVFHPGYF